jgi:excisionase family DNA binding protein
MKTVEAELLTVAEAAELLKVDQSTIRRWINAGTLPAYRVGQRFVRVKRGDLSAVITPKAIHESPVGTVSDPPQDPPGSGMRYVTSVNQIRPPTPEEREQNRMALARATDLRHELEKKYGEFHPSSWELLDEARRERIEQLP